MKSFRPYPLILIVLSFAFSAFVYRELPANARIPIHWGATGHVDGWADKSFWSVFGMPLAIIAIYLLYLTVPRIDQFKENYAKFAKTYEVLLNVTVTFFFAFSVLVVYAALKPRFNVDLAVNIGLGLLFIALGNFMGRLKRNFFIGIRTPWTIASDEVWRRTHRLGGRLMVAAGLLAVMAALAFKSETAYLIMLAGVVGATLAVVLYSYLLFRKIGRVQL